MSQDKVYSTSTKENAKWHKKAWEQQPNVFRVRYENLVTSTFDEVKRLIKYLDLEMTDQMINNIIKQYDTDNLATNARYTNYQKGQIGGFPDILTPEQINQIHDVMGKDLIEMDYLDSPITMV